MKQFSGYKAEAPVRREKLPAGGYVARIMDAREQETKNGTSLLISFDIVEGQYKDFFKTDYRAQQREDKFCLCPTKTIYRYTGDRRHYDPWLPVV